MSFTDFKEVSSNNTGSSTRYGGNDLKELMQIFNNKVTSNRRISIKNPWRFTDSFDMTPPAGTPASPTDTNASRIYVDPSDFKIKIKKVGGTVLDIENVSIPSSALNQITDKAKLNSSIVYNDQNNSLGSTWHDIGQIAVPANPSAGSRRVFVNSATGELSVRTSAGTTVSLEAAGGGGGNVSTTQANTYGDFDQLFRSGRLDLRNPANTFSYNLTGSAIAADRVVTFPLLTGNDTLVTEAFAQTLTNKTIAAGSNTISGISDAHIATHTTTKITTASKALLNSAIVYNDQNNDLGAFYVDLAQIAVPANPVAGDRRLFVNNADGRLSVRTPAGGTVALENTIYPDAASGGAVWGLLAGGARQGTGLFVGATATGTINTLQDSTTSNQITTNFATGTTSGNTSIFQGFQPTLGGWYTSRNQNFRFKCKLQFDVLTNRRVFIGLVGVNSLPLLTDTYIGTAVAGFGFRFSSTTDTTWKVLRNDTAGTAVTVDTGVTVTANTPDALEIIADEANTRMGWSIDGSAITWYTTDIPANTNPLNYFHQIESKAAGAQSMRIYYSYLTQAAV